MEVDPKGPPEDLLSSWKEIAIYLDTTVRTVQRWERENELPVRRLVHKRKASVYAYKTEIETWRASREVPLELPEDTEPEPTLDPVAAPPARRFRTGLLVGAAAVVVVVVALTGLRRDSQPEHSPRVTPLTALEGVEMMPQLSPDGKQVAFCWMQPGREDFDIYVANVDGGDLTPLVETQYSEVNPTWSPDGRKIAFMRLKTEPQTRAGQLVIVELDGGAEDIISRPGSQLTNVELLPEPTMTWSEDSGGLYIAGGNARRQGIYRFDIAERNISRLTTESAASHGFVSPAISPDGRLLAYVVKTAPFLSDVYVLNLEPGGSTKRLTHWGRWTTTPKFTPDGSEILVSSGDVGGERRFWSLDPAGEREPRLLALSGEDSFGLSLAGEQGSRPRMAFTRGVVQANIWRTIPGEDPKTELIIGSSRLDSNPAISPDGKRLVFESNRSGRAELWISDPDGANQRQLTHDAPPLASSAEWSPASDYLVVGATIEGLVQLFRVSPDDGTLTQLTDGPGDKLNPRWSRDGSSVNFFLSLVDDLSYFAKIEPPSGEVHRLLFGALGSVVLESPDGGHFTATMRGRLNYRGGGQTRRMRVGRPWDIRQADDGIAFYSPDNAAGKPGYYLRPYFVEGPPKLLAEAEEPWLGLSVTPDASVIYYSRIEEIALDLQFVDEVW